MSQSMKLGYPIENKYLIFTIAALISGFITSVCSLPMDLAKTRLQQQSCRYNGMISCLYGTARQEGTAFPCNSFSIVTRPKPLLNFQV